MTRELKYFWAVVSIFSFSIFFLLLLLKKYATLTFKHFLGACQVVLSDFLSTGTHYVGFILITVILVITLGLFLKTLLSYIKTKRKLATLLQKRVLIKPQKLETILERNNIGHESIIIVKDSQDCALTLDWFFPKIVISSCLVGKLTKMQLEAVILHEIYHLKNKHPLLLVISEILSSSLSLLPILQELTRKLRSIVEQEADAFVVSQQKTEKHLNLALNLVASPSQYKIFPSFSRRNDYSIRKISLFVSLLFIIVAIFLFKFPADTHTVYQTTDVRLETCPKNICSSHCPEDNLNYFSKVS